MRLDFSKMIARGVIISAITLIAIVCVSPSQAQDSTKECITEKDHMAVAAKLSEAANRPFIKTETSNNEVKIVWIYFRKDRIGVMGVFRGECRRNIGEVVFGIIQGVFGKKRISAFNNGWTKT